MADFGEHWRRKARTLFDRLDKDGDGKLTPKDFKLIAENVIAIEHINGERAEEIKKSYEELWVKYFKPLTNGEEATFEELITNIVNQGKAELKTHANRQFNNFFDTVDTNKDGKIQQQEYINFFQIVGMDESFAKVAFQALDTNHDGVLSRQEFVSAGIDFAVLEHPRIPSDFFFGPL